MIDSAKLGTPRKSLSSNAHPADVVHLDSRDFYDTICCLLTPEGTPFGSSENQDADNVIRNDRYARSDGHAELNR
jgi:hypothetical protein